jgi:hypothetical protein
MIGAQFGELMKAFSGFFFIFGINGRFKSAVNSTLKRRDSNLQQQHQQMNTATATANLRASLKQVDSELRRTRASMCT